MRLVWRGVGGEKKIQEELNYQQRRKKTKGTYINRFEDVMENGHLVLVGQVWARKWWMKVQYVLFRL